MTLVKQHIERGPNRPPDGAIDQKDYDTAYDSGELLDPMPSDLVQVRTLVPDGAMEVTLYRLNQLAKKANGRIWWYSASFEVYITEEAVGELLKAPTAGPIGNVLLGSQGITAQNEAYELKTIQSMMAACLGAFMHQLGGQVEWYPGAWDESVYRRFIHSGDWRAKNMIIYFRYDHHDHRKSEWVKFSDVFYGEGTKFVEGQAQLLQNVNLRIDGQSKIFDNSKGNDPIQISYEEEVSLENSVSSSVSQSFTFDVTVGQETTVSGEYMGASLEEKLSQEIHTGFSEEKSKDTAESKGKTTTVNIGFDVQPGEVKLLEVTKDHKRERIPTKGVFVVDSSIELKFYHWWYHSDRDGVKYHRKGQDTYSFKSIQDLWQFMQGTNTDYPELSGFWHDSGACPSRVRNGINHMIDPKNRSYYLDVDKERIIEDNADYKVTNLADPNTGPGQGLAVVDLSDEEERDKYTKS